MMKWWQIVLLGGAALFVLYYVVCLIIGTLYSLLFTVAVTLILVALVAAGFRRMKRQALQSKSHTRRLEKKADRALRELKKSLPKDPQP
jgi:membrane protein implicated in regulation of membrane protease activity